jgi:hypothetical protein
MRKIAVVVLLAALLVSAPVATREPSVDDALKAYAQAGWYARDGDVCIGKQGSDFVDAIVLWLAKRARGVAI